MDSLTDAVLRLRWTTKSYTYDTSSDELARSSFFSRRRSAADIRRLLMAMLLASVLGSVVWVQLLPLSGTATPAPAPGGSGAPGGGSS